MNLIPVLVKIHNLTVDLIAEYSKEKIGKKDREKIVFSEEILKEINVLCLETESWLSKSKDKDFIVLKASVESIRIQSRHLTKPIPIRLARTILTLIHTASEEIEYCVR